MLLLILGCAPKLTSPDTVAPAPVPAAEAADLNADATAGITSPILAQLLHDHWEDTLSRSPVWATQLGEHRFDDRISDDSLAGQAAARAARDAFLVRAQALEKPADPVDQQSLGLFTFSLEQAAAQDVCDSALWSLSARSNALVRWSHLPEAHPVSTAQDGRNLLARYRAIPGAISADIERLRAGLEAGKVANATSVAKVLEQLAAQLEQPAEDWPLHAPITTEHADWSQEELARYRTGMARGLADIVTAMQGYRDFIEAEILSAAQQREAEGLTGMPDGDVCYDALVKNYTTLPLTPNQIHQIGLDALTSIHAEFRETGSRALGTDDLTEIFTRLRTDPALYFTTEQEVEDKAAAALAAATAAMPSAFGRLPAAECVIRRIPEHEAPFTTIAYYRQSSPDGSKPGEYFVNTHAPHTRPRHEAEVLAYHEAIPGHHLQIAISQELPALPAFRRYEGQTAFVEGWALYTERLADEMGLYTADLDRLGMLSFDAWRASRLVVDTGVHHLGWSRQEAEDFLRENTPLADNNIVNEVDRYISWPGQALAYKIGQLHIRKLRTSAETALGEDFSLSEFHDVVLGSGAIPLPLLENLVRAWINEEQSGG
ncbi:MAG: DUF885 domain-containing protein [Myxococcota bacterium]|nr:DUF885 domain-containing protein [Myxococcota bacterium]